MEKLADDIRRLRNNLGLTQAHLAEILGVTVVTVSRWENGHVRPNRFLLKSLSSFLQDSSSSKKPDSTKQISKKRRPSTKTARNARNKTELAPSAHQVRGREEPEREKTKEDRVHIFVTSDRQGHIGQKPRSRSIEL